MHFQVPLADDPNLTAIVKERNYTQAQIEQITKFSRDGYLVIDLDIADLDDLIAGIKRDVSSFEDGRAEDAWGVSPHVKRLANSKVVMDTLDLLYGRKSFPFQTLNFPVGTQQRAHSDTIHFHCVPERFMAGVWAPLEPTDANNGPVCYYPGSHKLPCFTLADVGVDGSSVKAGDYSLYVKYYEPMIAEVIDRYGLQRHEAHLKPGQAFIWAANLIHGGSPILEAGRTRCSQVTHYFFEDCLYYTPLYSDPAIGKIYYRNPVNIASGEPAGNRYCGNDFAIPRSEPDVPQAQEPSGFLQRVFKRRA